MPFVTGFPARQPSGQTSIRVYISDTTAGADFTDTGNSFVFIDQPGANPYTPLPVVQPGDDVSKRGVDASAKRVIPPNPAGTGENYLTHDNSLPVVDSGGRGTGHLTQPSDKAYIWSDAIRIENTGANPLEISFNGTDVHGIVAAGEVKEYYSRREAAIAVRGPTGNTSFIIEAW